MPRKSQLLKRFQGHDHGLEYVHSAEVCKLDSVLAVTVCTLIVVDLLEDHEDGIAAGVALVLPAPQHHTTQSWSQSLTSWSNKQQNIALPRAFLVGVACNLIYRGASPQDNSCLCHCQCA